MLLSILKKCMGGILLCLVIILLVGCKPKTTQDTLNDATNFLNSIKCYYAVIKIDIQDENQIRTYQYKQWVKMPNQYRVEVIAPDALKGKITVSNGTRTWMFHPQLKDTVELAYPNVYKEVPLFVGDFLSRYWNSEKSTMEIMKDGEKMFVVLTAPSTGARANYSKERLVMDMKNKKPVSLSVFDEKGDKTADIVFDEFRVLSDLDAKLFNPPKP